MNLLRCWKRLRTSLRSSGRGHPADPLDLHRMISYCDDESSDDYYSKTYGDCGDGVLGFRRMTKRRMRGHRRPPYRRSSRFQHLSRNPEKRLRMKILRLRRIAAIFPSY